MEIHHLLRGRPHSQQLRLLAAVARVVIYRLIRLEILVGLEVVVL
jgi:hypothetical protein